MPARVSPLTLVPPEGDGDAPRADASRADISRAAAARVEALFREHYKALVVFAAHYTRRRDVAEEVVQEVFLQLWDRCERDGGTQEFTRSYLFSSVRYRVLPVLRHERVVHRWSERAADDRRWSAAEDTGANAAVAALEADDLARAVRRAVAGLSEKTRVVFLLSRDRGLTYAEIAEVVGVSVKTVELHMTRALKVLRASLRGVALGVTLCVTAALAGAAVRVAAVIGGG